MCFIDVGLLTVDIIEDNFEYSEYSCTFIVIIIIIVIITFIIISFIIQEDKISTEIKRNGVDWVPLKMTACIRTLINEFNPRKD